MRPTRKTIGLIAGSALAASGALGGVAAVMIPAVHTIHSVGTVSGQLFQDGGPVQLPPATGIVPVNGDMTFTNVATGATFSVHVTHGGYSIALPAGKYKVVGLSSEDFADGHPMGASGTVIVHAGRTSTENLYAQIS